MDKIPVEVLRKISKFISILEKNNIHINKAFLFGSYAKGTFDEWSDIDLALVSDNFSGNRFIDKQKIRPYKTEVDYSISPLPYKTEDFDTTNLFVKEIVENGVQII